MSRTASLRRAPTSRPLRRRIALSQNFLANPRTIETILDRSSVGPDDVVYEIGPGDGAITSRLARRCRHVVAVEKDPRLADRLRSRFVTTPNVTVFLDDFLTFPLPVTHYKVFANIPFAITAAIVARLTEASYPPEDAYLCVQREAAQRFTGAPRETLVSLLLRPTFEPSVIHRFERLDFTPAPGVEVVLLRLRKRGPPLLMPTEVQVYRDFVTHTFTTRLAPLRPFEEWLRVFRRFQVSAIPRSRAKVRGAEARLRAQQAGLQKEHRTRVHS